MSHVAPMRVLNRPKPAAEVERRADGTVILSSGRALPAELPLVIDLLQRLQRDVRAKFGVPLLVIYSWPDETSGPGYGQSAFAQSTLVDVLVRLRNAGIPLLAVDQLTSGYDVAQLLIPHDGHPTAFSNELIAGELKRRLLGGQR